MSTGNTYLIKTGSGAEVATIAGQLEGTMTLNGTAIEITNKASGGYVEYLDGFVAGKQVTFAGSFTLLNDEAQNQIKADMESGALATYTIESGVGDESWTGSFSVVGRSDSAPLNDKVTMSVTFSSSGEYIYTPPTLA